MRNLRNDIKRLFALYVAMFGTLVLFLIKFLMLDSHSVIINSYNPRLNILENKVIRGAIKDYKGESLAITELDGNESVRRYPFGTAFAHIVGYSTKSKTGIEALSNFELLNPSYSYFLKLRQIYAHEKFHGNDVILTLDKDLQITASKLMGDQRGAIIIMEPSTGKILTMVSKPDFDPNDLEENWERLNNDTQSPLLNRATQGLYPPGSIFKIITATAVLENIDQWENFTYTCTGEDVFDEDIIRCYESEAHGIVGLNEAFTKSCNTAFAQLGTMVGSEILKDTAERVYFNQALPFPLEYNSSQFPLDNNSLERELVETAMGQGRTLVSPLHMSFITSAIANGGLLMKPYIIDHLEDVNGNILNKNIPTKEKILFEPDISKKITELMTNVVTEGTGKKAKIENITVAGKTGTAENGSGAPHAWFIGFAPADKPEVAIVVLIENGGVGGSKAAPIAKQLLIKAIER